MDPLTPVEVAPDDPRIGDLVRRHLELMRASSPACSVHAMEADALADAGARMVAVFDEGGVPVAMGAMKLIDTGHAELKSMHVVREARGRGLGRVVLRHLLGLAEAAGAGRVSLETGSQEVFGPARAMYRAEGFEDCGPFEGYAEDPASTFLTRVL